MRRALPLLLVVLLFPTIALAATGSVVSTPLSGGLVSAWAGKTLGIARSFIPLLFVIALAAEAFGKPPTEPRDYGAVVWRLVIVGVLLTFYGQLFGGLAGLIDGVAQGVAPAETWEKLQAASKLFLEDKARYQLQQMQAEASSGNVGGAAMEWITGNVDSLGGVLVDSVVSIIILLGQAAFRIVGTFGEVLKLLLYVLGPLALVASIPRGSGAGGQWLRVFISVLIWPLISALLVGLMTAYALDALRPQSSYDAAYKSIALAGLLMVTAFAVPTIASALTGAGMSAVSAGWSSMNAWTGAVVSGVTTAGAGTAAMTGAGMANQAAAGARGAMQGGGIQSSGIVSPPVGALAGGGGGAGGGPSPAWAKKSVGSIVPAVASVSPAADAAAARELAQGVGGAELKPAEPVVPSPPPFANDAGWSAGGIVPAKEDDNVPTVRPFGMPGPAAAPVAPRVPVPGAREVRAGAAQPAAAEAPRSSARAEHQKNARQPVQPAAERPTVQLAPPFPKKR